MCVLWLPTEGLQGKAIGNQFPRTFQKSHCNTKLYFQQVERGLDAALKDLSGAVASSGLMVTASVCFFLQCLWELVPWEQTSDPAGHGQNHESKPCPVCVEGTNPQRAAALLLRAHRALPVLPELWGALLQPDHLVCG